MNFTPVIRGVPGRCRQRRVRRSSQPDVVHLALHAGPGQVDELHREQPAVGAGLAEVGQAVRGGARDPVAGPGAPVGQGERAGAAFLVAPEDQIADDPEDLGIAGHHPAGARVEEGALLAVGGRLGPDEQAERRVGDQAGAAGQPPERPAGPAVQEDLPQPAGRPLLEQPDAPSVQRRHGVAAPADRGRPLRTATQHEHLPVGGDDRAVTHRRDAERALLGRDAADPLAGAPVHVQQPRRVARHQQAQPGRPGQRLAMEVLRDGRGGRRWRGRSGARRGGGAAGRDGQGGRQRGQARGRRPAGASRGEGHGFLLEQVHA